MIQLPRVGWKVLCFKRSFPRFDYCCCFLVWLLLWLSCGCRVLVVCLSCACRVLVVCLSCASCVLLACLLRACCVLVVCLLCACCVLVVWFVCCCVLLCGRDRMVCSPSAKVEGSKFNDTSVSCNTSPASFRISTPQSPTHMHGTNKTFEPVNRPSLQQEGWQSSAIKACE